MRRTFFSNPVFVVLVAAALGLVGCGDYVSTEESSSSPDQVVVDPVPTTEQPEVEEPEVTPAPEETAIAPSFEKDGEDMRVLHMPGSTGFLGWNNVDGWPVQGLGLDKEYNPHPSSVVRVGGTLPPIDLGVNGTFYGGAAVDMAGQKPAWGDNTNLFYFLTPPEGCDQVEVVAGEIYLGTAQEALLHGGPHFNQDLYGAGIICPN